MNNKYIMNPIGVRPQWMVLIKRNKNLADAISRYSDFENSHTKDILETVKKWASEIVRNCDTEIMMIEDKEKNYG